MPKLSSSHDLEVKLVCPNSRHLMVYEWTWCAQTLIISSSTINDFTTSFLHFPPFCTALWHQKSPPPLPQILVCEEKSHHHQVHLYFCNADKCFSRSGVHTGAKRFQWRCWTVHSHFRQVFWQFGNTHCYCEVTEWLVVSQFIICSSAFEGLGYRHHQQLCEDSWLSQRISQTLCLEGLRFQQ